MVAVEGKPYGNVELVRISHNGIGISNWARIIALQL